jgi:ABC-2 type transport system permease protein
LISAQARGQYAALAEMRWRMLMNSLRTKRGNFELAARILGSGFFSLMGLGAGFGLGFGAWTMASQGELRFLPLLLWPVFAIWQLVPVTVASYQEHVDLGALLRFPVSFGSYVLLFLGFGLFDISSILGGICLAGIWMGLVCARPLLALWATPALALFAAFNILLTRMIFAWIDRWLARRRTREILGTVFLFLLLGAQLLNPAFSGHSGHGPAVSQHAIQVAERVQRVVPPGLAAGAIRTANEGHAAAALESLGGLALFGVAAGSLLGMRLRAEYRGENLGEVTPSNTRAASGERGRSSRSSSSIFEGTGPIGAVIEKELRYILRSGVMLYSLVAPLIMLFIFGNRGGGQHNGHGFASHYALPFGVAYGFLGLTRLVYNSLGGEGAGIQLYFLAPTRFRTVMLAKNLVHVALFCLELALVCAIVSFRYGLPSGALLTATICWLLFALPVQLAAGNVLSIMMAYRMTMARVSREQGSAGNGMLSLLIQFVVFGVGVAVYLPLARLGHAGLAAPVFLVLAAGGVTAWVQVLARADRMAAGRREALIGALARAA